MPRNVRNFWIELEVDGVKKRIETGPRAKDGGFRMTIKMRDGGEIIKAADLKGYVDREGGIVLEIWHTYSERKILDFTSSR